MFHASSAWGLAAVSLLDWLLQGALDYGGGLSWAVVAGSVSTGVLAAEVAEIACRSSYSGSVIRYSTMGMLHMCSSHNLLPRAAGRIQYEAKEKLRPSNCILPEA